MLAAYPCVKNSGARSTPCSHAGSLRKCEQIRDNSRMTIPRRMSRGKEISVQWWCMEEALLMRAAASTLALKNVLALKRQVSGYPAERMRMPEVKPQISAACSAGPLNACVFLRSTPKSVLPVSWARSVSVDRPMTLATCAAVFQRKGLLGAQCWSLPSTAPS